MNTKLNNIDNCLAVFQGGGCKAVAYIGAYEAALEKGIIFSEVAGTSAGSIIASLIAAGATPKDMKEFLKNEKLKKLAKKNIKCRILFLIAFVLIFIVSALVLDFFTWELAWAIHVLLILVLAICLYALWHPLQKYFGYNSMNDLQQIVNDELYDLLKRDDIEDKIVRFKHLYKPLYIVTSDVKDQKEKVFTCKDEQMSVAEAVCASCAIPFIFQPPYKKHVDGGLVSNSPIHLFAHHPAYHRILSFQLKEVGASAKENFATFFEQLVSTVVDGATGLQAGFGIQVDNIVIPISQVKATEFKLLNSEIIDSLVEAGKRETTQELNKIREKNINSLHSNALNEELKSYDQLYSLLATYSCETVSEVVVSTPDTLWVWHMFPTLLKWVKDGAKINVYYLKKPTMKTRRTKKSDEDTRQKLLDSLGCYTEGLDNLDAKAFFIKSKVTDQWRGAIYEEKINKDTGYMDFDIGCYYDHKIDSTAMRAWVRKLREESQNGENVYNGEIKLCSESEETIIQSLRDNCYMYSDADLHFEKINREQIEHFTFLTDKIRMYKYRQIDYLFDLYDKSHMVFFAPARIELPSQTNSIIGPIVIERKDGKEYVIEGHTRLLYAYTHDVIELYVLYVDNTDVDIPKTEPSNLRTITQLVISDNKPHVYTQDPKFRHIEAAIRSSRDEMLPEAL